MKLVKSFAVLGIATTFLFSCKDTASKPAGIDEATSSSASKTAAIAQNRKQPVSRLMG